MISEVTFNRFSISHDGTRLGHEQAMFRRHSALVLNPCKAALVYWGMELERNITTLKPDRLSISVAQLGSLFHSNSNQPCNGHRRHNILSCKIVYVIFSTPFPLSFQSMRGIPFSRKVLSEREGVHPTYPSDRLFTFAKGT